VRVAGAGSRGGQPGAHVGDLAIELGLGEAEADGAALLLLDRGERVLPLARLGDGEKLRDVGAVDLVLAPGAGHDERRAVAARRGAGEAAVEDGEAELADQLLAADRFAVRPEVGGPHPGEADSIGQPDLGVDVGVAGVRAGDRSARRKLRPGLALALPAAEGGADLRFHRVGIDVAGDDQGGALGPVIGIVEFDEAVAAGGLDHVGRADRHPRRQDVALEQIAQLVLGGAQRRVGAGALLGEDDAALAVDRGGAKLASPAASRSRNRDVSRLFASVSGRSSM
jgi:hypothetical protein